MLQTITSPMLMRLASEALFMILHHAPDLNAKMVPGASMALTGESFADMNIIFVEAPESKVDQHLKSWVGEAEALNKPYLVLIAPEAASSLAKTCEGLGLKSGGNMPFMACEATGFQVASNLNLTVNRVADERDWYDYAVPMAAAFELSEKSVRRTFPQALIENPALGLYLARDTDGAPVGCVMMTSHGPVRGIWSMAVHPNHQRKGYGKVLITQAMDEHHRLSGAATFFLGSSPAGLALYQRIGFQSISDGSIWVKDEQKK